MPPIRESTRCLASSTTVNRRQHHTQQAQSHVPNDGVMVKQHLLKEYQALRRQMSSVGGDGEGCAHRWVLKNCLASSFRACRRQKPVRHRVKHESRRAFNTTHQQRHPSTLFLQVKRGRDSGRVAANGSAPPTASSTSASLPKKRHKWRHIIDRRPSRGCSNATGMICFICNPTPRLSESHLQ